MRVLVTDGNTRPALAVTRALGRLGHTVTVTAESGRSLASSSRYCAASTTDPGVQAGTHAFVGRMREIVSQGRIELLVPVTEATAWLLANDRDRLPSDCSLPLPSTASLAIANDKARIVELAAKNDVPVPRTQVLKTAADRPDTSGLEFPLVLKPARSRVPTADGFVSTSVQYATCDDDLASRLAKFPPRVFPVLLQERIIGQGMAICACYRRGKPVAFFSHVRLREKPPSGGVSVLCESVPIDPNALAYAKCLLSVLNWHGVAMVEFKREERSGELRLMEINGRFWGSLQLAIDAGVDFPRMVAQLDTDSPTEALTDYAIGVRLRWLQGDLDALLARVLSAPKTLNLPPGSAGRVGALRQFLESPPGQRNEIWRSDDIAPAFFELANWLRGR